VVDLPVVCDLPCQTPVVSFGHCVLENVEVTPQPGEQVVEPHR
jgi:hypothetical protein